MESRNSIVSTKGVFACLGGAALYWLSRNSGRDASNLRSVPRMNQLKELAELLDDARKAAPTVVALAGRVGSDAPLTCRHNPLRGVILEEVEEQNFLKHNDSGSWVQDSAVLLSTTQEAPWYLTDGSEKVMVVGARKAAGLELTTASESVENIGRSALRSTIDYFRGLKMLGVKRVERVLPVGAALTVVGEAVRDDVGTLRIQKPHRGPFYVSPKSIDQLVSTLGKWSRFYSWLSMSCTLYGVWMLAGHSVRHLFEKRRRKAIRKRVMEAAAEAAAAGGKSPDVADAAPQEGGQSSSVARGEREKIEGVLPDLCVICLEQKYTAVFVPCGHMCCCSPCSAQLSNCPLCRRRIEQVVRAYRH